MYGIFADYRIEEEALVETDTINAILRIEDKPLGIVRRLHQDQLDR